MKISEREIENLKNKCNIIITDKQALKEIIADNLREIQKKKHLTQEVVAEIVGLTRQSVSRHEQMIDIPDITNLIKYAILYDSSVDYILGIDKNSLVNKNDETPL